jgi:hypothetical protein
MVLRLVLGGCLLVLAACGGGSLSLAEFATEGERLVADMNAGFAALDSSWEAETPTKEGALEYWKGRLEIRRTFLDGIKDLDPPREVEEMHETSIGLFTKINEADEALATRVEAQETVNGHWDWDDTPEGRVSLAITEEIFDFCRYSQGQFDATQGRGALIDVPWVPSEMTEVISVAFGCPPP